MKKKKKKKETEPTVCLASFITIIASNDDDGGGGGVSNGSKAMNGLSTEPLKWDPKEKDVVFVLGLLCLHQI